MDDVKEKEQLWKEVRLRLKPFFDLSNLWLAALDGIPVDEFNYLSAARQLLSDPTLNTKDKRDATRFMKSIADALAAKKADLIPFHWQLEFPDVFFDEHGKLLPPAQCGFDAVLGNPPYVSIHTAMESGNRKMRDALQKRAGYLEDLYVHFTDLGFTQLRNGGGFGFIVSDTFFTLASKLRMREILQANALDWLGQCDPFDATVDAAVFVARKQSPKADHRFRFIQARPLKRSDGTRTKPQENLEKIPADTALIWNGEATSTPQGNILHLTESELRIHDVPLSLFTAAHKRVFFEPRPGALRLFDRFNPKVKELVAKWWDKIEDSRVFSANLAEIEAYHHTLRPGDITLVGLIAEGGQGMRTANNARFLAFLDGTPQADDIKRKSQVWSADWMKDERIRPVFTELLRQSGGDPVHPTADRAAWESAVHTLREQFTPNQLGFGRTALFHIAPTDLIAAADDFAYAFQRRKAELLAHWKGRSELNPFWDAPMDLDGRSAPHSAFRKAKEITDEDFCALCQDIQLWITRENAERKPSQRIPREAVGLRSSEDFADPADAPRVATIYNGLYGRAQFVPFRKGDPTGSRWLDNEPLYCDWSKPSVDWLSSDRSARWQGHRFFLKSGATWSLHANHVATKCRYQEPCIFDASSSRLTPIIAALTAEVFVGIANSDVFSFFLKKFIKHNQDIEINDMRVMPIPIPSAVKHAALTELATLAMAAKRHEFAGTAPDDDLVSRVRELGDSLRSAGPAYLHPSAQGLLLSGPADCLEVIEKAVNWEAEKLYGVEGLGPFDEF